MAIFDQSEFEIRCEWGRRGLQELAPVSDVVVVVDVLSFSTAVDIATARGAIVFPYPFKDDSAEAYADSVGAGVASNRLASNKRGDGFSLSPDSLRRIPDGYRLVLPSPNGAALCFSAGCRNLLTGCLRNASAVSEAAKRLGSTIAVIPAGETWDDGSLRPCLEDLIGAGSVIAGLPGRRSPEAELAVAAFERFANDLPAVLRSCASGKELIERGFATDVDLAAEHNVSRNAPVLKEGAFAGMKQL